MNDKEQSLHSSSSSVEKGGMLQSFEVKLHGLAVCQAAESNVKQKNNEQFPHHIRSKQVDQIGLGHPIKCREQVCDKPLAIQVWSKMLCYVVYKKYARSTVGYQKRCVCVCVSPSVSKSSFPFEQVQGATGRQANAG